MWGSRRRRIVAGLTGCALLLAPLAWMWQASLVPRSYSVAEMGTPDLGGGAAHAHPDHRVAVPDLTEPGDGTPDVRVRLIARSDTIRLDSGQEMHGLTLNGTSPGPVIRAEVGQLVEVELFNESVTDGTTLHWHGVEVPNAMDGVAGVTQDAVPVGSTFTYRFRPPRAGTYWYHSHQVSHEQVPRGLIGALVVEPRGGLDSETTDLVALVHSYGGTRTVNGATGEIPVDATPGDRVRVRVINTGNGPISAWVSGTPFRLAAIDASDVHRPETVTDRHVQVTAGGRADLELVVPASGARVELSGPSLVLGPDSPAERRPEARLDPLTYGEPAPLGFDPERPDRRFDYAIGRRPAFVRGRPGLWWSINGHLYPDVPMFMVAEKDVVRVSITSRSDVHPMHLHGHRMVVLSRDGQPATGSPWWVDSLNVAPGETYEVAFVADNPGAWMFHCHHLGHAAEGLVAHLMYHGVAVPYRIGDGNVPE
ncbi:multicopper oxidase family protein [Jiangella asiatica]|uniref:Multicopper oxidase family protein n=1 Tax=Jiangella asiatica TaxID=2530372 RepID=A0A4R5CVN7_9ACTN|nr:multicopper oxidase family protein [Jiangella asiatica]TDE03081.1 multicopper oxidase family protein [Jiangella asiatica]